MIKMKWKEEIKSALIDKNEEEKSKRVEENSKLKEIILYNQPDSCGICNKIKELLESEGINYVDKIISENESEYNEVLSLINFGSRPIAVVNGYFLAYKRDFNSPEELVNQLRWVGNPSHVNSSHDNKVLEHLKTTQYYILESIKNLKQEITPVINVMKSLLEEDDE